MLMPLPATLRRLVKECETLLAEQEDPSGRRLRDLAYTLCVSTGTREIADALVVARSFLADPAAPGTLTSATVTRSGSGRVATAPAVSRDAAPRPGPRPTTPPLASTGRGDGR
ncbi:DUF5133 domain-containing protein [Streptomyces triticiradicis]|uniref:DUF5133 domain-containing protein n=1 Tax=Streptomyces triticiradicis TaxID=2651189 RepID=A0A7J5DHY5_9ACTN|nr:DUF5133 domain-containing protein [Streptomyces triticiradicis]KAB1988275.1 DUF5133 domain-containing protein [Streptomyces triticiradicis]